MSCLEPPIEVDAWDCRLRLYFHSSHSHSTYHTHTVIHTSTMSMYHGAPSHSKHPPHTHTRTIN